MKNPAEIASEETLNKIYKAIDDNICFRVEAGAGAGKTYSLIKALEKFIESKAVTLQKSNQKVACITYTNIAKDQINSRIDNHPIVYVDTIHGFCWSIIEGFQKQMRNFIPSISEKWQTRVDEIGGVSEQRVKYDLGYPKATDRELYLHHDDIIKIFTHLLSIKKFVAILKSKFPVILIDEYQDTDKNLANSIIDNLITNSSEIQVGFFGDHWQKIYEKRIGLIQSDKILEIGKNANFRSDRLIVEMLSRMRPNLPQNENDPLSKGDIAVYHTNSLEGIRRTDNHWQGDLPASVAHDVLNKLINDLGWEVDSSKTKILMLTNNVLAQEQGYSKITSVFKDSDDYLKKNDHYVKFFIEVLEPMILSFELRKYGEMFKLIGSRTPRLKNQDEKTLWNQILNELIQIRKNGTVGEIIDFLKKSQKPRLPSKIEELEEKYIGLKQLSEISEEKELLFIQKIEALKAVKYSEVVELTKYVEDKTPFSTKHGVKGAEFENVLVVCGRGWNNYNWDNFLIWANDGIPNGREDSFERNRNLFYVSCSRPKKRLVILFTQKLSPNAFPTLENWFLSENIKDVLI